MKVALKILYGSQNYCLDGPDSDKDYKLIMLPSFDDLFYKIDLNAAAALPTNYDKAHYSTMDIRQWHNLMLKGNVNALEYLFSRDIEEMVDNKDITTYLNVMRTLMKSGYIAQVWDSFYSSVQGVALNAIKRNGINSKTISRAYYYYQLITYLNIHSFEMDESTWRSDVVCNLPYYIRYKAGDKFNSSEHSEDKWQESFELMKDFIAPSIEKIKSERQNDYLKEVKLVNSLVKDIVKGEIFNE